MINIYTDGSYRSSTNEGGFGIVALKDNYLLYAHQQTFTDVTNNQMELQAIKYAYDLVDKYFKNEEVIIWTDSSYCANSITTWAKKWEHNGWKNSKKETIANLEIIQSLYNNFNINFPRVQIQLLKGHVGTCGNELADSLATLDSKKFVKILLQNNINFTNVLSN